MTLSDTHDHGEIKKYPLPARKRLLARVSSGDAFLARLKLTEGHISFKFCKFTSPTGSICHAMSLSLRSAMSAR